MMRRLLFVILFSGMSLTAQAQQSDQAAQEQLRQIQMLQQQLQEQSKGLQADPEMMQKMMKAMQSPNPQAAIQEALKDHEIDMSQYRDATRTACNEERFLACSSGYSCTSTDHTGKKSTATIKGREGDKCRIEMRNEDGSTGVCQTSDSTMRQMLTYYHMDKIKLGEMMEFSKVMMKECSFKDASGKPLVMPQMPATNAEGTQGNSSGSGGLSRTR